jgi:hypothetical protein
LTIDKNMHSMASGLNNETGAFASMEKGFGWLYINTVDTLAWNKLVQQKCFLKLLRLAAGTFEIQSKC